MDFSGEWQPVRNGIFASDRATVTTFWTRHGDYLTWVNIVKDPVYLTEPLIRSGEYRLNLGGAFPAHPCTPAAVNWMLLHPDVRPTLAANVLSRYWGEHSWLTASD